MLHKKLLRDLKNNLSQFITIFLMIFLGIFAFSGIHAYMDGAITKNPKLLLCDEPTGALDSKTGVEILKLLKNCCNQKESNNTVIIVTHNSLIAEIADTIIKIKNGQIESITKNKNPKDIDEVVW